MPDLEISAFGTPDAFAYWSSRPFHSQVLKASIGAADIVLVPYEGFRDYAGPVFPSGTEELFTALREGLPPGARLELAAEDDSYHEIAVHFDWVILATFLVTSVAAPVAVDLIVDFLKKRLGSRQATSQIKTSLIIQQVNQGEARAIQLSYEGPAPDFERVMTKALSELSERRVNE